MENLDAVVTTIGIIYGALLVLAAFVSNKFTESIRIDALFIPKPTESTRILNLIVGLVIIGYNAYSLFR